MNDNRPKNDAEKGKTLAGYLLWLGLIAIAVAVGLLFGWKWALLAAGVGLIILAILISIGKASQDMKRGG